jgi:hypothetical protein
VTAATEVVPQPLAIDTRVTNDSVSRTLVVSPAESSGYSGLLWREGWRALLSYEQRGGYLDSVWASTATADRVAYAEPEPDPDRSALKFHFQPGNTSYGQLVSKPGLRAFVTIDLGTCRSIGVRFRHRP